MQNHFYAPLMNVMDFTYLVPNGKHIKRQMTHTNSVYH